MNKLLSLIKINLLGLVRGRNEKKSKKIPQVFILLLALALIAYYSYLFASNAIEGYKLINAEYIILPQYFVFTSLFLIITNYKKIKDLFFEAKDLDMLQSMPIKKEYILISKIFEIYLYALIITFTVMLPPYFLYINAVSVTLLFHVLFYVTLLFIPCIPIVIAVAVGYLISYISSFFRKKESIQTVLSIAALLIGVYIGEKSAGMTGTKVASFGESFINLFNRVYPITKTYKEILIDSNIISLIIFIIANLLFFTGLAIIISKTFDKLNGRIHQVHKSKNTKIKYKKKLSKTKSLLVKDFKKLFSSANYLMNSCMGVVMLTMLFVTVAFKIKGIEFETEGVKTVSYVVPFIIVMLCGFIYPAAVSMSLEGKCFNVLKNLPITFNDIIKEKMLFEIILMAPITLMTIIAVSLRANYSIFYIVLFIAIAITAILLYTNIHLLLDMLFLKLEWVQEIKIIKQSLQSFLSLIASMLIGILPLVLMKGPSYIKYYLIILIALFIIVNYVLRTYGKKKFENSYN